MQQEQKRKEAKGRKDYWLHEGIVVKVLNKRLGDGKYYKEKGASPSCWCKMQEGSGPVAAVSPGAISCALASLE